MPRLPKPPSLLKAQLVCLALCLIVVAGSRFDVAAFNRGRAASDNEAMEAFVNFSKPFQGEVKAAKIANAHPAHKSHDAHEVQTVWTVLDGRK